MRTRRFSDAVVDASAARKNVCLPAVPAHELSVRLRLEFRTP
jgi:hypothetical protein